MERGIEDTIEGFAPLLDPELPCDRRADMIRTMRSTCFHSGGPDGFVCPSFDLLDAGFDRRRYWRGPIWINTSWLLWSGLHQHGHDAESDDLLASCIALVERSGFREYRDPIDRAGYGSDGFAWSAALTIDLIERHRGTAPHRLIDRLGAWSTMIEDGPSAQSARGA